MAGASAKAIITQAADSHGIDPAVLWGLYGTETGFGADVKPSSAGALGPFQFEPATAASIGLRNVNDFPEAANAAAKLLSEYKGRGVGGMLSAYNAGPAGGYQAGYVNETLQNAKSYGATGNISLPASSQSSMKTITGKPARSERVTTANPHAQGLAMLESLIASEGEGSQNPLIATGVLSKAAAPTTSIRRTGGTPARTTTTGVPAASTGTTSLALPAPAPAPQSLRLPGDAPAPSTAAQSVRLPRGVAVDKAALEHAEHHPVSVPQLSKALAGAESRHEQLVKSAPVVAEAPRGKVVATPKGPVYVPHKNPLEQITGSQEPR